jgi:hypothetical protein
VSELFPDVYRGKILSVSPETDAELADLFPELSRRDEYIDADAWMLANPRRRPQQRGTKRFLINFFRKSEKARIRQARKDFEMRREMMVGAYDWKKGDL